MRFKVFSHESEKAGRVVEETSFEAGATAAELSFKCSGRRLSEQVQQGLFVIPDGSSSPQLVIPDGSGCLQFQAQLTPA